MHVHFSNRSLQEIDQHKDYLASQSPAAAEVFLDAVFDRIDELLQFPRLGRVVPELNRDDVRELIYRRYRIIYQLTSPNRIDILAVWSSLRPLDPDIK